MALATEDEKYLEMAFHAITERFAKLEARLDMLEARLAKLENPSAMTWAVSQQQPPRLPMSSACTSNGLVLTSIRSRVVGAQYDVRRRVRQRLHTGENLC